MPDQKTDPVIIEHEKQTIRQVAGLSVNERIDLNENGWDSRVYSFHDGRYFFKFPRSQKVQERYKYELAAIRFVDDISTDIICQKIKWEHPSNAYFGYEGVPGQPLSNVLRQLNVSQKQAIGSKLGVFLREFHTLTLPGARTMSLEDESDQIKRWYEDHQEASQKYFTTAEQDTLRTLVYEIWPAELVKLGSEPVLSHGDLHFENVLYQQDGSLGIIDFGDVGYYDRSKDFLELDEDETLFQAVLKEYGNVDQKLQQKIAVRKAMIQIINFGFHAGKGNKIKTRETAERIKAFL